MVVTSKKRSLSLLQVACGVLLPCFFFVHNNRILMLICMIFKGYALPVVSPLHVFGMMNQQRSQIEFTRRENSHSKS